MTKEQIGALAEPTRTACIEAHRRYLATARDALTLWRDRENEHRTRLEDAVRMAKAKDHEVDELTELLRHFLGQGL